MTKKGAGVLWAIVSFLLFSRAAFADVGVNDPRAQRRFGFAITETIAEINRPYVHFLRASEGELYTIDTDTGQFVHATQLSGVPGYGCTMAFSLDGKALYVPLASAQKIQIISISDLSTIDFISVGAPITGIVPGFDGMLYISAGGSLYQVDPKTGGSRALSIGNFYSPLIKGDSTGRTLYLMELGLSGGGEMVEEFSIVGGTTGLVHKAYDFNGKANDADFEVDLGTGQIYGTAGGVYGINVWNMSTHTTSFWPYEQAYGTAVAHVPGSPFVYGSAGYQRIRRFEKTTGRVDATFDLAGGPWFVWRSLQATTNGHVFYAVQDSPGSATDTSIGILGIEAIGDLPPVAPILDAGSDRSLATGETLRLPIANWTVSSGPGPVTFATNDGFVIPQFQFGGKYILKGSVGSSATGFNHDQLTVQVATPITTLFAAGATGRWKVPTSPADLTDGTRAWTQPEFNDSAWIQSSSALGYEYRAEGTYDALIDEDVGADMYGKNRTLLLRCAFNFRGDTNHVESFKLRMTYNDGFVAFLNGREIARSNFTGTPAWNSGATTQNSSTDSIEFDIISARNALTQGANVLAIQALNNSATDLAFLVRPELRIAVAETAYSIWTQNFPGLNPTTAAPLADPDGDGLPNFLEFAMGGDPTVKAAEDATLLRPTSRRVVDAAVHYLEIAYPRLRGGVSDIVAYRTLFSPNLAFGSWRYAGTTDYPTEIRSVDPIEGSNFEWVTERLLVPIPNRASVYAQEQISYTGQ